MSPFLVEHVLSFPQEARSLHVPGFLNLGHLLCFPVETYTKPPLQLEQLILLYVILISHALSYFLTLAHAFPSTKKSPFPPSHGHVLLMFQVYLHKF